MLKDTYTPFLKSPMTVDELVNVRIGIRAKGSCRLMRTFSKSFMLVRSSIPRYIDINTVGRIAIDLVSKTLCQRFHFKFRNP